MFISRKKIIQLVFIFVIILLLRFDLVYFSLPYKIQPGETYWGVLNRKVFHNPNITRMSLEYLKKTHSQFDWNYVQANINGEGGYDLNVWMNKLTIAGPDGNKVLNQANLLPPNLLRNHTLQVISYNLIIISVACFFHIYFSMYKYKYSKKMLKDLGGVLSIFTLSSLLFFVLMYLLGNVF